MIRDFDESGGRPLRGPESFKRPVVDEDKLELLASNEGQAAAQLRQVIDLLKAGRIAQGVRRAKALARWLEGQPYAIYCANLSWLLWYMATYAPPAVARSMVRPVLSVFPTKGRYLSFGVLVYMALARIHRRRGCALRVRRCCHYLLKKWSDRDRYSLAYLPYFFLSELLHLEGKYEEALSMAEKSVAVIKEFQALDAKLKYAAQLHYGLVCEALGKREEAHACYATFLDDFGDHSYMPRALHEKVWGGFHRTKEPVRPKF